MGNTVICGFGFFPGGRDFRICDCNNLILQKMTLKIHFFKMRKKSPGQIRWNFGLKTCPKNQKKKVEEHKAPSEFQSNARFLR